MPIVRAELFVVGLVGRVDAVVVIVLFGVEFFGQLGHVSLLGCVLVDEDDLARDIDELEYEVGVVVDFVVVFVLVFVVVVFVAVVGRSGIVNVCGWARFKSFPPERAVVFGWSSSYDRGSLGGFDTRFPDIVMVDMHASAKHFYFVAEEPNACARIPWPRCTQRSSNSRELPRLIGD